MNTTENNKIIAEFMGQGAQLHLVEHPQTGEYVNAEYHTSWDWLMPCVKKIREIHNVELSIDEYSETKEIIEMINPFDYSIEQVCNAVVEFIKWYNTEKATG